MNKRLAAGAVLIVVAFAFGRYSAPEKVKVETVTVEVEKKTAETDTSKERNRRKETTTRKERRPDGTEIEHTTVVEDSKTEVDSRKTVHTDKTVDTRQTREEYRSSGVSLGALGAVNVSDGRLSYGAYLQKDVVGPLSLGAFGLTSGTVGLSIGIRF